MATAVVPCHAIDPDRSHCQAVDAGRVWSRVDSRTKVKLPFVARWIVVHRLRNYNKIAVFAGLCTLALAIAKFELALQAERAQALASLQNTGLNVAKALRLQMQADLATLDTVANLWSLSGDLSREDYRKFILSPYFSERRRVMDTIMLVHRIQPSHQEAYETHPDAVRARAACCNSSEYDIPSQHVVCRSRSAQCKQPGDRFQILEHVMVDGQSKVRPASADASARGEHLVVYYQEPCEVNPGPMGMDLGSLPDRREGFTRSDATGGKGVTGRLSSMFVGKTQYCMLVWNNVFANAKTMAGRSILGGVPTYTKQQVIDMGGEPYSIGSVVAKYSTQRMLVSTIAKVFGREISNTRIYFFDGRAEVPTNERLLAVYDPELTEEEMVEMLVQLGAATVPEITGASPDTQSHSFDLEDLSLRLTMAMVPSDSYFASRVSNVPYAILGISIGMVLFAQAERWVGHPSVVSQSGLIRDSIEAELRAAIKEEMSRGAWLDMASATKPADYRVTVRSNSAA